ncbi:hypothetical protein TWF718_010425 [Orbilia javanica]|uniref:Uncharacterized protein n=1 Tax=Orbilia javanica TaxID=47235 RepID=A0AAN8MQU8_9PEZI
MFTIRSHLKATKSTILERTKKMLLLHNPNPSVEATEPPTSLAAVTSIDPRTEHINFLQKAQEDCNRYAERFRTYCAHTQKICRELIRLSSWNTYQEEKILIARETELMHMYCQLSDEVVRIREHIREVMGRGFGGCGGDRDTSCRCWMDAARRGESTGGDGAHGEEKEKEKERKEKRGAGRVWEFAAPDGKISFLDNKEDILEVGRRAEDAVYLVLGGANRYSGVKPRKINPDLKEEDEDADDYNFGYYDDDGRPPRRGYPSYFACD